MTSSESSAATVRSLMVAATLAHKRRSYRAAEASYRAVLEVGPHPGAAVLLATVLLSRAALEPGLDTAARVSLRASALPYARDSVACLGSRSPGEARALLARCALFLLDIVGLVAGEKGAAAPPAVAPLPPPPPEERALLLAEAIEALQRAVALDPGFVPGWRNLALALKAGERHGEAEGALRAAVAASGAAPPWDLLYRHGKALKRCGREGEALARYCDAAEASGGAAELALFWLRVALAEARERPGAVAPELLARCGDVLSRYSGGGGGAPPHAYIRKLFDGYSAHFDAHLVGVLGYKTPNTLLTLTRATFGEGAAWRACADLGCGTGLAGVAFRDLVRGPLDGCDLSPGMVAEARKRSGLYRLLEAGEVVEWLCTRTAAGEAYDLLLSADVLVYLGALEPLFAAVAHCLRRAASTTAVAAAAGVGALPPPSAFIFSTEALLGAEGEAPEATFELTPTGRCRHSAAYIRRLAGAYGFAVHAHARETIRMDKGHPVTGDLWIIGLF